MELTGFVLKCVGGFYTVEAGDSVFTCRARGRFRKERVSPCAGDRVLIEAEEDGTGFLKEILPRKNLLTRPPLANLDRLFIVASLQDPKPEPLIIDKTIAAAELLGIEPVVVLTKADLKGGGELKAVYDLAGIPCVVTSSEQGAGMEEVRALLWGKVSAFTGNTGVGKSSLLNAMFPDLKLSTGEISQKLGRGRHTTRVAELYRLGPGSYAADTPGFSTFDVQRYRLTDKERLPALFREFTPFLGECQFTSCSHTKEKGCAVLQAVRDGKIAESRHKSYVEMYEEIKDIKLWQQKNQPV